MKLIFENWNNFLNEEKAKDVLSNWEHKDAAKYAQQLVDEYGEQDVVADSMLLWHRGISEFTQTYVKDESSRTHPRCGGSRDARSPRSYGTVRTR